MIDLLNQYIGADTATYLGTFLGFIALLFTSKKVISNKQQKQSVKGGSGIQAGGDVKINVNTKD